MKNSNTSLWNKPFSHIYIEKSIKDHRITKNILSHFNSSNMILIDDYKDLFSRSHQSFSIQKNSIKLILAQKKDNFLYKGSPVCESFGNKNFYYTSSIMNCIYDCEYCYLQGMYPSANIIIFVNIEDVFSKVDELSLNDSLYVCISYDTDLLALEGITGFTGMWLEYTRNNQNLLVELRTKSSNFNSISHIKPPLNFILAWTLSPDLVINKFELKTPSLKERLESINEASNAGYKIRLCFDPILYIDNWRILYKEMLHEVLSSIDIDSINDISIGTFRISKAYYKNIRKNRENSLILSTPMECKNGIYSYNERTEKEIIDFMYNSLIEHIPAHKIFVSSVPCKSF